MSKIKFPNNLTTPEDWAERRPENYTNYERFRLDEDLDGDVIHLLSEWEHVGDNVDDVIRAIYDEGDAAEMPFLVELEKDGEVIYKHRAKTSSELKQQIENMCFYISKTKFGLTLEVEHMKNELGE